MFHGCFSLPEGSEISWFGPNSRGNHLKWQWRSEFSPTCTQHFNAIQVSELIIANCPDKTPFFISIHIYFSINFSMQKIPLILRFGFGAFAFFQQCGDSRNIFAGVSDELLAGPKDNFIIPEFVGPKFDQIWGNNENRAEYGYFRHFPPKIKSA